MEITIERIKNDIDNIAEFNATPGNGITRFSYSPEDKKARAYLSEQFLAMGLKVKVDGVGNIRARLEGKNPALPVVMSGSHIDTVLHGGKFDGVLGSVCALEVVRTLVENKIRTNHPVEIVIFAEEEGSNFGSTMTGSKFMTGRYTIADLELLKNDEGVSLHEMAGESGLFQDTPVIDIIKPGAIKAMIELHVEQGGILEDKGVPIGIVENIAGGKWYKIDFEGMPNHAGATPMHLRQDPLAAAAEMIHTVIKSTRQKALPDTVCTVGKIMCQPNIPNCIPGKVTFTLDVRDVNPVGVETVLREAKKVMDKVSEDNGVKSKMELTAEADAIGLSEYVTGIIEKEAVARGLKYMRMNSGAVHDSSLLANVTDVGMIFVPSKDGRSHVPEEETGYEDIKTGCNLLLASILTLAGV